ncbi:VOC family protein [Agromyces sp. MMS24-K17]|uniref:VOC family protein n=1 Tax=Agromyces sp. MMS24-K17 TaxID=3372850 RepID=UPI003754BFF9
MTIQTDRPATADAATSATATDAAAGDLKLEVVVIPVADVDRALEFYDRLGWTLDVDLVIGPDYRVVEFTPTGSPTSIIFGTGVTDAQPGSARGLHLVVSDVEAARARLVAQGVAVSGVFHDATGVFHHGGAAFRMPGLAPNRGSYGSFAAFEDPDGNEWVLQEITTRIPGRIVQTRFDSPAELARALRSAAVAHGEHEARIGAEDPDWPEWYAEFMVRAAAGQDLPE